ncbi:MAG TPA: ferredoxin [Patescibacteria group bacterium]
MAKYKIEFDRQACIGALVCNLLSERFYLKADDGKVDLANAVYNEATKKWELIIDEADLKANKEAAESCPVDAIKVTKIED